MPLDFVALADGLRRNNVGLAGIVFEATVTAQGDALELQPTGQRFPLEGAPPAGAEAGAVRARLRVVEPTDPRTAVAVVAMPAAAVPPAAVPARAAGQAGTVPAR